MSMTIWNDRKVTWEQVVQAINNLEGFSVEKDTEAVDRWWISWVVDEYEPYAKSIRPEIEDMFRNLYEPVNGMFVMRCPFYFNEGRISYNVPMIDDLGIILVLFKELGVGYASDLDDDDEEESIFEVEE